MKTQRTALAIATALGILSLATQVRAADPYEAPKVSIKFDQYDLTTEKGASALYARLRAASREVCTQFEGRELRKHEMWQTCYNQALSDAVARVNQTTVTALHQRATHGERAS